MGDDEHPATPWIVVAAVLMFLLLMALVDRGGEHCPPDAQPGDCPAPVQEYP